VLMSRVLSSSGRDDKEALSLGSASVHIDCDVRDEWEVGIQAPGMEK